MFKRFYSAFLAEYCIFPEIFLAEYCIFPEIFFAEYCIFPEIFGANNNQTNLTDKYRFQTPRIAGLQHACHVDRYRRCIPVLAQVFGVDQITLSNTVGILFAELVKRFVCFVT